MAIIIEDGTGKNNAVSYVSYSDASTYHSQQGNDDWPTDETEGEIALIKATSAVDLLYGPKYKSSIRNNNQSLLFPRYSFIDNNGREVLDNTIPYCLKQAVMELALSYVQGDNIFPTSNSVDAAIEEKTVIDTIELSYKLVNPVNRSTNPLVDAIISPLIQVNIIRLMKR